MSLWRIVGGFTCNISGGLNCLDVHNRSQELNETQLLIHFLEGKGAP